MGTVFQLPTPLQQIENELTRKYGVSLFLKRDDLIHPQVSGNKWRKLKYHLEDARQQGKDTILTVGGAYSNHITATAAAAKILGFNAIGIIRGDELNEGSNPSLQYAAEQGMRLIFADRLSYAKRYEADFRERAIAQFKLDEAAIYYVPEGGATELGRTGCAEIVDEIDIDFKYIACACGTGTTISGIAQKLKPGQQALGIVVLNAESTLSVLRSSNLILHSYPFGGYAKANHFLLNFIKKFQAEQRIELDYVYTGKMLFGIFDLMQEGYFPAGSTVIAVHTGGVMNARVS